MKDDNLDKLIDFVIKDAFEGLSDTDPSSVERSIRAWFKSYQPERSKREDAIKECEELGHVHTWMPKNQTICMRCGALNTMET